MSGDSFENKMLCIGAIITIAAIFIAAIVYVNSDPDASTLSRLVSSIIMGIIGIWGIGFCIKELRDELKEDC